MCPEEMIELRGGLVRLPVIELTGADCTFYRLRMVVDHIAKPYIKDQKFTGWKEDLEKIGKYPNIYCKM